MYFEDPIPMVIFRDSHILYTNSIRSSFNDQIINYATSDCFTNAGFVFPTGNYVRNYVDSEFTLYQHASLIRIYLYACEKSDFSPEKKEAYTSAFRKLSKELEECYETFKGERGAFLKVDSVGRIQESTFGTLSKEKANDLDINVHRYDSHTLVRFLPTGPDSSWCWSDNPRNQKRIMAMLASTVTLTDLSELLSKTGANKNPIWIPYREFVKSLDWVANTDDLYKRAIRTAREFVLHEVRFIKSLEELNK